ncbi:MAG: AraD1 family protein [Desulfuromonadales bacterium]
MRLVQFTCGNHPADTRVAVVSDDGKSLQVVAGLNSTHALARAAINAGKGLADMVAELGLAETIDYDSVVAEGRLLPPITHPDPAHMLVTGTGLTHLGSASTRSAMHATADDKLTDSMKMFKAGLDGGKPAPGQVGAEPEWFFKGDGSWIVAPGQALELADSSLDGGEEPEVAGIYVIADDGTPCRVGYAIGNEYSDHVLERRNYLLLAHSKLRTSSFGPELLVGDLPAEVKGTSRILRNGQVLWEKPFASGESNMNHSIANLEYHHFKYTRFRRPADVHVHFFGTATLSFADQIKTAPGDVFEITAEGFGRALQNPLAGTLAPTTHVRSL